MSAKNVASTTEIVGDQKKSLATLVNGMSLEVRPKCVDDPMDHKITPYHHQNGVENPFS